MKIKINKNILFATLSVVGIGGTIYCTHKSTLKAVEILKNKDVQNMTKKEIAKETYKAYIPTAIVGGATLAIIIGNAVINRQSQLGLIAASGMFAKKYDAIIDKIKTTYGEDALKTIKNDIQVEGCDKIEEAEDVHIESTGFLTSTYLGKDNSAKKKLFYDSFGDRWFYARLSDVISAEYHLNRNFVLEGHATLNMLYDFLGLEATREGNFTGWEIDDDMYFIDFDNEICEDEGGNEYYVISATTIPCVMSDDIYKMI